MSSQNPGGCNLFREGKYIVAPVGGARFPNRCVKSNKPVSKPNVTLKAVHVENQLVHRSTIKSIMRMLNKKMTRKYYFKIGMTQSRKLWASINFFLGPLMAIVATSWAAQMLTSTQEAVDTIWEWVLVVASIALGVIGIALYLSSARPLSMLGYYGDRRSFLKLAGACKAFLDSLPDISEKPGTTDDDDNQQIDELVAW